MYPASKHGAIVAQMISEAAVVALASRAYELWLPFVTPGVLPSLTAAGQELPPDPSAVTASNQWWAVAVDQILVYGVGLIFGIEFVNAFAALGGGPIPTPDVPLPSSTIRPALAPAFASQVDEDAVAGTVQGVVEHIFVMSRDEVLGIDALLANSPDIRELQSAYLASVHNRLADTPASVFRDITTVVDKGLAAGMSPQDMRADVGRYLDQDDPHWQMRALTIARTESCGAQSAATQAAALLRNQTLDEDLEQVWLCTLDSATRDSHFAADGQRVPLGGKFKIGHSDMRFPGDPEAPIEESVNCFTGDTPVWVEGAQAVFRSWYSGPLIQLSTRSGRILSGTPNHPMLTELGWLPLGQLNKGNSLVNTSIGKLGIGANPDVEGDPITFAELFASAQQSGQIQRVERVLVNFHGDRPDGEIDVIPVNSELRNRMNAAFHQHLGELMFTWRGMCDSGLACGCSEGNFLVGAYASSNSRMRCDCEASALIDIGSGHSLDHCLTSSSGCDSGIEQNPADSTTVDSVLSSNFMLAGPRGVLLDHIREVETRLPAMQLADVVGFTEGSYHTQFTQPSTHNSIANIERIGDGVHRLSGLVSLDKIVHVQVIGNFSGHVYTLQSESGLLLANSNVSRNCRCRLAVLAVDEPLPGESDRHTERGATDSTVKNRTGTQAEEIASRADDGIVRARDDPQGVGRIAASISDQEISPMSQFRSFKSVLALLGMETDDGRMLANGMDLAFRDFPMPLMWQRQSEGGHFAAFTVGVIESAAVLGSEVIGAGYLLNTPEADEAAMQAQHQVTGPSVDLGDVTWELRDENGNVIDEEQWWDNPDMKVVQVVTAAKVLGATLVATPAFGQTSIDVGEMVTRDVQAQSVAASLVASVAAEFAPTTYDASMFTDPEFDGPTHPHITADGRIQGHLAAWNVCHVGIRDRCVMAPHSLTDYAWFLTSPPVTTDKGPVKVGRLTVSKDARTGGHAGGQLGAGAAVAHYDNTGTCFGKVNVGEDAYGIWFSGIPDPKATPEQIAEGLSAPLSGDWRTVAGNYELVAALAVNTPGYPLIASGATDENDDPISLIASLGPCKETATGPQMNQEQLTMFARIVVDEMRAADRRVALANEIIETERRRAADAMFADVERTRVR